MEAMHVAFLKIQTNCQFRLKIPHCAGRKFPAPKLHEWASLASDGVEPSAGFWRVLGATESEAKERAPASAPSCPRGVTSPALRPRSLAEEPDTYEFDSTGKPTTALFDYEVFYKFTSHFVYATVCALESHITERGDTFKIRARWNPYSNRKARLALFNVLAITSKIFICGFRALGYEQPEEILKEMHTKMQSH